MLLELVEAGVERQIGVEGETRRLRDLAQLHLGRRAPRGDDLAYERLPGDHAGEPAVVFDDEHRPHVLALRKARAGVLRVIADPKRRRLGHHRVADRLLDVHG